MPNAVEAKTTPCRGTRGTRSFLRLAAAMAVSFTFTARSGISYKVQAARRHS